MAKSKVADEAVERTVDVINGKYHTNEPDTEFKDVTVELKYGGSDVQFFVSCPIVKDGIVETYTARGALNKAVSLPTTAIRILRNAKTTISRKNDKGKSEIRQVQRYVVSDVIDA